MKVDGLKTKEEKEKFAELSKKTIRVQALGDRSDYVGYYNHIRRRGGDVFVLKPIIRERRYRVGDEIEPITGKKFPKFETHKTLITAEQQFSSRWMKKVATKTPETPPVHFNQAGKGRPRYEIPGMTNKVGGENDNILEEEVGLPDVVSPANQEPTNEEEVI